MKLYLLVTINLFLLISCKKYKAADPTFFLKASSVTVVPNKAATLNAPQGQGTASHKITDLFLYVNGRFQGIYPVGSLMPVITKGQPVTVNLFAGIKNNGISNTRISFIFYQFLTLDTLAENGKTVNRSFAFHYDSNVKFEWVEDFDSGTGFTVRKSTYGSDVNFKLAPPADAFEGKSIMMELSGDSIQAQLESNIAYPLPAGSSNVYMELNYKCTAPFEVGLIGDDAQRKDALVINPQPNWNKIYIALADPVSKSPISDKYQVYFRMLKTDAYPNPKMYLDNIKLIHF